MILRLGRPRRALIVAPHPDDETIGAFGLMRTLSRGGTTVSVLVVTDGRGSHLGSVAWPTARLVRERQAETRRAMRHLAIPSGRIRFLGLPDGELSSDTLTQRRIRRAVRAARPDLLVGPTEGDDHADHRVVAAALAGIGAPVARRLGYPVWPLGRRLPRPRTLALGSSLAAEKRRAVRSYRTQTGRIVDDPTGFALTPKQIAAFSRPMELFEELSR